MKNSTIILLGLLVVAGPGVITAEEYTAEEPYSEDFIVSQDIRVGSVLVWEEAGHLNVKYVAAGDWCFTETGLTIAAAGGESVFESPHRCISETTYRIPVTWDPEAGVMIRAEASVGERSMPEFYASYYFADGQPRAEFLWPPMYWEGVMGEDPDSLPTVVLNVNVPPATPPGSTVYVMGNFGYFNPGYPSWDPKGIPMTEVESGEWTVTLTGGHAVAIAYAYTLGSFDTQELGSDCNPTSPRTIQSGYGNGLKNDSVINWGGVSPCGD